MIILQEECCMFLKLKLIIYCEIKTKSQIFRCTLSMFMKSIIYSLSLHAYYKHSLIQSIYPYVRCYDDTHEIMFVNFISLSLSFRDLFLDGAELSNFSVLYDIYYYRNWIDTLFYVRNDVILYLFSCRMSDNELDELLSQLKDECKK